MSHRTCLCLGTWRHKLRLWSTSHHWRDLKGVILHPVFWFCTFCFPLASPISLILNVYLLALKVKVAQSCPTLCDPIDYTVHGILQARILEWVAFPFSRGSSQPRDWNQVSHIAGIFLPTEPIVCFIFIFFKLVQKSPCAGCYSKPFTNINSLLSHNYACTIHLQIIKSWHWEIPYHMYLLIYRKSLWKIRKYIAIHKQLARKINWNIYLNAHLYFPVGSDIPDIEMYILTLKWFESVYGILQVLKTHCDLTRPLTAKPGWEITGDLTLPGTPSSWPSVGHVSHLFI